MTNDYTLIETSRGPLFDDAPGFPDRAPILNERGSRDHRGGQIIAGCGCKACLSAGVIRRGSGTFGSMKGAKPHA